MSAGLGGRLFRSLREKVKVGLVAVGKKQGPVKGGGGLLGSWVWFGVKIHPVFHHDCHCTKPSGSPFGPL